MTELTTWGKQRGIAVSVLALLVTFAAAAAFTFALTGPAAAQSGSVNLEDPIYADQPSFEVEIIELTTDGGEGCLEVYKNGGFQQQYETVTEGETITIDEADIEGGYRDGDEISVELYTTSTAGCGQTLIDSDTTTVQATGSVTLEDPITSNQGSFDITVTELRIDDGTGCVGVEKNGELRTIESEVAEGETRSVDVGDVGGLEAGDELVAQLIGQSLCDGQTLDEDATTVIPEFAVTITGTNSPVVEGDPLELEATVENTGSAADTQNVRLTIGGELINSTTVTLAGGETETVRFTWETEPGDAGEYGAEVASQTDADVTAVTVNEPGGFAVTITGTNSPVVEGDPLEVEATVENRNTYADTQNLTLTIGGELINSTTVTLAGGETETVRFTWETEPGDAGEYEADVASPTDADSTNVTVNESAEFAVRITGTNSPVIEGDPLEVEATVENTGAVAGTRNLTLTIGGEQIATTSLTLDGGETETVRFTWETEPGDAGEYEADVASPTDADSTNVTVDEPAEFAVRITGTNSPVSEGSPLEVEATVENTGTVADTQNVRLTIGGELINATTVTLAGGEAETVTFTWETELGDAGEYEVDVASDDDADETKVQVETLNAGGGDTGVDRPDQESVFAVTITGTNSPVVEGDPLEIEATVENTGSAADTQNVRLTIGGELINSTTVTLDGGETETVTFTWGTEPGDAGEYEADVASQTDADSTNVTVNESGGFAVTITGTNSPVVEGDPLEVEATVENTGSAADTQNLTLTIGGELINATTVTLDGGETETVRFTWETEPGDAGEYEAEVASDDADILGGGMDIQRVVVQEQEPAEFAVTITGTNSPVVEGNPLEIEATVENTGTAADTQNVVLTIGDAQIATTSLTLDGGETETVRFTWETEPGDAGEYEADVASDDDADETNVQVETSNTGGGDSGAGSSDQESVFEVRIEEVRSPERTGGPLEVDATVENTGTAADTQTVTLIINGEERDGQELTLAPNESTSVTFTWADAEINGESDLQVASEDDADESTIRINGGDDGLLSGTIPETISGTGAAVGLLLLLLLLLLAAYYYIRRRQMARAEPGTGSEGEDGE